ncbi:MAG: DUF456 domain-containing protein [Bacteroidales bacterium]|nr:DUF456 domain-containing protein [Bacteroidales bacterium]
MDLFISILAVVAGVAGIVGSIMPALPGPPLSWLGLLILFLWGNGTDSAGNPLALKGLLIWGAVVVAVTVIDYFVPMYFTKITGGSRYAEKGAMVGLIAGIILTPVGMILGSFLGAFLFELYYSRKGVEPALKAAFGSFLGFITGTGIKTIVSCLILWRIIVFL